MYIFLTTRSPYCALFQYVQLNVGTPSKYMGTPPKNVRTGRLCLLYFLYSAEKLCTILFMANLSRSCSRCSRPRMCSCRRLRRRYTWLHSYTDDWYICWCLNKRIKAATCDWNVIHVTLQRQGRMTNIKQQLMRIWQILEEYHKPKWK